VVNKRAQSFDIEPEAREAVARLSRVAWAGEAATGGKVHSDDESMYRLTATRTPSGLTERSELDESERDERYTTVTGYAVNGRAFKQNRVLPRTPPETDRVLVRITAFVYV
jgi:hypothetical protein